jgi:diaminohydroxyphosphoribosylaminopyrimidine deaminase/5-amino-6-(5-phosphoribosylamino)uracil reductase
VLVGIGTVLADDPLLTNRRGRGKQPARIVVDSRLRTPPDCRLVRSIHVSPVIVATTPAAAAEGPAAAAALRRAGVEILELPAAAGGVDLGALLDELGRRQWTYLLVEGGAKVLGAFVLGGLADELAVFVAGPSDPVPPRRAKSLPRFDILEIAEQISLDPIGERHFGEDTMCRYRVRR